MAFVAGFECGEQFCRQTPPKFRVSPSGLNAAELHASKQIKAFSTNIEVELRPPDQTPNPTQTIEGAEYTATSDIMKVRARTQHRINPHLFRDTIKPYKTRPSSNTDANILTGRSKPSAGQPRLNKRRDPMSSARRAISPRKSTPSNELGNSTWAHWEESRAVLTLGNSQRALNAVKL